MLLSYIVLVLDHTSGAERLSLGVAGHRLGHGCGPKIKEKKKKRERKKEMTELTKWGQPADPGAGS